MTLSDWIALAACIAAFLGLIPQFAQIIKKNKKKKPKIISTNLPASNASSDEKSEQPPMLKALILVVLALVVFLIEIIIFKFVAHLFNVSIVLNSMSLLWTIMFFSLFLIPGLLLFFALNVVLSMFED